MNCTLQTRILRFVLMSKAGFLYNRTLLILCGLSDEGGGSVSVYYLFEPHELLRAAPGVVEGGTPCRVPTWIEHAKNHPALKKIERTF